MARIVYITSRFPFPAEKGDQLRAYFQILHLARIHELHLIAIDEKDISKDQNEALSNCASVSVFHISKWKRIITLIKALFTQLPFQVSYFVNKKTKKAVELRIQEIKPEYIHCHLIRCSEYVKDISSIPKSLDFMDAFSLGMEKRAEITKNRFKRWIFTIEARRLKRYEEQVFFQFDRFCIISDQDRKALGRIKEKPFTVIPNGVDFSVFFPKDTMKKYDLCFMGNISYPPNSEAIRYFVESVFPELLKINPAITFLIAGANPPKFIRDYASKNIVVQAYFKDISDSIAMSKILISPLIISIGLANKVIQAMAMKVPNIVSENVAAAIEAEAGKELLVANSVDDYVSKISKLLSNLELSQTLSENAFRFVMDNYNWDMINNKLENFIVGEFQKKKT